MFTKILIILCCLAYGSTALSQTPLRRNGNSIDFKNVLWLAGTWERKNSKTGQTGHERWEKISDRELHGFGVTMKGQDTVFMEKLKIVAKDDALYYVADVPDNKQPVLFKLTEIKSDGFVCENPEHDFPKKITYQREGTALKATISGNGKSIDYLFERKQF